MIIIAHNNGRQFLPQLIESLGDLPFTVVDTGSTDENSLRYLLTLKNVLYTRGGWSLGAYKHAVENIKADWFFFMHDSMVVKDKSFLDEMKKHQVCGWLSFPMFFDNTGQEAAIKNVYPGETPDKGIFGPIFYATKEVLDKITIHKPESCDIAHGMERGMAMAFHQAGVPVSFLDELSEERLSGDMYQHFTKIRPMRP